MPRLSAEQRARAWAGRLAGSRIALPALFALSLLEALVLPVPIELILVPWMLLEPGRLGRLAHVALAGCLVGATLGYLVGALSFDTVGQWALAAYGHAGAFEQFTHYFERYGFWAIVAVGVFPIPFQAAMLAAGATGYPLTLFLLATLSSRGLRYYGLAVLVRLFGARAWTVWREHRVAATVAAVLTIALAAAVARIVTRL